MKILTNTPISLKIVTALSTAVLASALFIQSVYAVEIDSIVVYSEEYPDHTNKDGTGVYWQFIEEVYADTGVEVKKIIAPYARAVAMVESEKADFWVASYIDEEDFAIYPKYYFDADNVTALYKKETNWVGTEENLKGAYVSWVRGYDYNEYLDFDIKYKEVVDGLSGVKMLKANRVSYYLDDKAEILDHIQAVGDSVDDFKMTKILNLPLYMAFQKTPKGEELARIWDEKFAEMLKSGRVEEIFKQYNVKWEPEIYDDLK